jgi:hypothetical protein
MVEAEFRVLRRGASPRRYLHIHGNEETAREVLTRHMETAPGVAFLVKNAVRNVPIEGGLLDPNRMFSRSGAEANLRRLNPEWKPEEIARALDRLDRARPRFLRALLPPREGRLMALHNNSEGYNVHDDTSISDRVSLKEPENPRAFFLCTDPGDFARLAESPYNAVLQQKRPTDDDGSLSRLAARMGIRYINLEVALGDAVRQREMLLWVERHLP